MAKKRRVIHCGKCESPVEVYKKGKKHRVFICPNCGVIATNPSPLALAGPIYKAMKTIPGPAKKGIEALSSLGLGGEEPADTTTCNAAPHTPRRNLAPFYINKALSGGA